MPNLVVPTQRISLCFEESRNLQLIELPDSDFSLFEPATQKGD
jgi:hypothetical protein